MKNILFLHDTSLSTPRGAELTILQLIALGQQKNYNVTVDYLNHFEKSKKQIEAADLIVRNGTSNLYY